MLRGARSCAWGVGSGVLFSFADRHAASCTQPSKRVMSFQSIQTSACFSSSSLMESCAVNFAQALEAGVDASTPASDATDALRVVPAARAARVAAAAMALSHVCQHCGLCFWHALCNGHGRAEVAWRDEVAGGADEVVQLFARTRRAPVGSFYAVYCCLCCYAISSPTLIHP